MTAQIAERLLLDGEWVSMCTTPLDLRYLHTGYRPEFAADCTALWRGYVGHWELNGGRLYLIGIRGQLKDGREADLQTLFHGFPDRVFAHWYSGTLRVPRGEEIDYVHMGFASLTERDQLLRIERGVLVGSTVRINRPRDGTWWALQSPDWPGEHALLGGIWSTFLDSPGESGSATDALLIRVRPEHLGEWLSVQQIEARERVHDPLGAVPDLAFGHLNGAWKLWLMLQGEAVRYRVFSASWTNRSGARERTEGYVAIEGGRIGMNFISAHDIEPPDAAGAG